MNRFVLTGAPGSGKTPIIAELVALGYGSVPEPARAVLAEQRATGGDGTHDRNPQRFNDLMLERSLADFHATGDDIVFFDRGLPDLVVYAEVFGLDPSAAERAAREHRYEGTVFVTPSWPEIYTTDEERRMTFEQAEAFGRRVEEVYASLGYTLVEVPRDTPAERARFIASRIAT